VIACCPGTWRLWLNLDSTCFSGDFFADKAYGREQKPLVEKVRNVTKPDDQPYANVHVPGEPPYPQTSETPEKKTVERKVKVYQPLPDEPIKCLTYKDPFSGTYKKFIYTADGKYLLGGMMVGDVSDFVKLVAITKKKKPLDMAPSEFIVGKKAGGEDDGADLDDDATICSCHNVSKGAVGKCIKDGCDTIGDLKAKTKVGTGCGGCMPLVTSKYGGDRFMRLRCSYLLDRQTSSIAR
jgi:nitrite reductase (NAD(P)H)